MLRPTPSIRIKSTFRSIIRSRSVLNKIKSKQSASDNSFLHVTATYSLTSKKLRQQPFCPFSHSTKSLLSYLSLTTSQNPLTVSMTSSSSRIVISFRLGSEFAHKITLMFNFKNSTTSGRTPRHKSIPQLSANSAILLIFP